MTDIDTLQYSHVELTRAQAQTIPSGANTPIVFTAAPRDAEMGWDLAHRSRWVPDEGGYHAVKAQVSLNDNGANNNPTRYTIGVMVNGTIVLQDARQSIRPFPKEPTVVTLKGVVHANVNAYIELFIRTDNGAPTIATDAKFSLTDGTTVPGNDGDPGGVADVLATTTQNKSLTSDVATAVSFDSAPIDLGTSVGIGGSAGGAAFWSGGSPTRFTIPTGKAGAYVLRAYAPIALGPHGTPGRRQVGFRVNGGTTIEWLDSRDAVIIPANVLTICTNIGFLYLNEGDYVEMMVLQDDSEAPVTGGPANLTVGATFSMVLVWTDPPGEDHAFLSLTRQVSALVLKAGITTPVPWDHAISLDPDLGFATWDPAHPTKIVATIDDWYTVLVHALIQKKSALDTRRLVGVKVNGGPVVWQDSRPSVTTPMGAGTNITTAATFHCTAGDYFEIVVRSDDTDKTLATVPPGNARVVVGLTSQLG